MMCDVMPTIVEDALPSGGSRPASEFAEEANFEQLMVDMLHERDKLMENLGEAQDMLQVTQQRLNESEQAKTILIKTLEAALAKVSVLGRERRAFYRLCGCVGAVNFDTLLDGPLTVRDRR